MIDLSADIRLAGQDSTTSLSQENSAASAHEALVRFRDEVLAAKQTPESEPPKKRRRTTKEDDVLDEEKGHTQYVTLADVNITLNSDLQSHSKQEATDAIAVSVVGYRPEFTPSRRYFMLASYEIGRKTIWSPKFSIKDPTEEVRKHLKWASNLYSTGRTGTCDCNLESSLPSSNSFTLRIKIQWKVGESAVNGKSRRVDSLLDSLLDAYLPSPDAHLTRTPWSPQDFYNNVHVPRSKVQHSLDTQAMGLATQLYPFQDRAVSWLLEREGVQFDDDGELKQISQKVKSISFRPMTDATGQDCCVDHLTATVSLGSVVYEDQLNGGILAEEMGLGKTVELIALILLHKREVQSSASATVIDSYSGVPVVPSSATLIITPPTILEQWKSEMKMHAPALKVLVYEGVKHAKMSDEELKTALLNHDVVLTTYGVLTSEIHYAAEKPKRNLRNEKKYEPRRTPLVQIMWWRLCLDEAQMIESGVSNAARVARVIPRCNSWAVTGTPLKKDIQDLLGLLIFLRYSPYCITVTWNRLIQDHKGIFARLISTIAMRHNKAHVSEDLHIPPQKRLVVTVPFTAIEDQNYSHLFQQMCDECGLDSEGAPLREDWNPENSSTIEKMRSWLTRLRQTCLHAEIGVRNRRALGRGNGPLRTLEEVLEVLIDQNETNLRAEERAVLNSKIQQGHFMSFGKDRQGALEVYLTSLEKATAVVEECREHLADEQRIIDQSKAAALVDVVKEDGDNESTEDETLEDSTGKLNTARLRLRAALEVQHVCTFFSATAYFQLKESLSLSDADPKHIQELEEKETKAYEQAKIIRKELLVEVSQKTQELIGKVASLRKNSFATLPPVKIRDDVRGIESRKIFDAFEDLANILNDQSNELQQFRSKLVDLLTMRLLDQDEDIEITGDEYETSTKQQDEQYVLHEALRAAHADRYGIVTGQVNLLINHEMGQALKLAKDGKRDEPEEKGPAPELMLSMLGQRERMLHNLKKLSVRNNLPPGTQISMRGIIAEARSMITSIQWQGGNRAAVEATILERELQNIQSIASQQTKALLGLEKEIDLYRSTMNQRLEFYRQLQHISDMVAPLQETEDAEVDMKRLSEEKQKEATHGEKLAVFAAKRRFLEHLRTESSATDERRICVICQSTFEIGVLTVCGHQYCKDCIGLWWTSKGNCPSCKRVLRQRDFHEITFKPQALKVIQEEQTSTSSTFSSPSTAFPSTSDSATTPASIYTPVPAPTLISIQSIDLRNNISYGTKIDTISRHLIHLRSQDPGSKSIIFSQYADFLSILSTAFTAFQIGHTSIATKNGIQIFREDPSKEAFLMHAKADSSGLNLVNATHVFLCEPLVNTALELQAIARVHRIGQKRATNVYMYLVADTVEESIYQLSVARRLAHMQQKKPSSQSPNTTTSTPTTRTPTPAPTTLAETSLDAANSLQLQSTPVSKLLTSGKSGGEVVEADDLWTCLFGGGSASRRRRRGVMGVGEGLGDEGNREVGRFLREEAALERRAGAG